MMRNFGDYFTTPTAPSSALSASGALLSRSSSSTSVSLAAATQENSNQSISELLASEGDAEEELLRTSDSMVWNVRCFCIVTVFYFSTSHHAIALC